MEHRTEFIGRPSDCANGFLKSTITVQEKIAYITMYYPTPKFVEMTFDETEASSNQSESSQKSIRDSSSQKEKMTVKEKSLKQKISIGGLSEIKAKNFRFDFNGIRSKQDYKKSAFQTQFDYQQLIGDIGFEDHVQEKAHFSAQKNYPKMLQFEVEEKDQSFTSEKKKTKANLRERYENPKSSIHPAEKATNKQLQKAETDQNCKWDSPSEILFKRKNKLMWLLRILENHDTKSMKQGFLKIWCQSKRRFCKKCNKTINKSQIYDKCSNCRSKEPSLIESSLLQEKRQADSY